MAKSSKAPKAAKAKKAAAASAKPSAASDPAIAASPTLVAQQAQGKADAEPPEKLGPVLDWMNKTRQWGVRVKPGKAGLRLGDLNVGIYGEIPMHWDDQSRNPRGAVPRKGMPPVGYAVREKVGMWADSAADLYEEAIQRRWAPATDVPWDTIEKLPEDIERAICQVCTELSQFANVEIETIAGWQHQMVYGYHEVKQYLATASFDAAKHYECFRKRALVNGGGLGVEGPGQVNRMILESSGGWSATVAYLVLVRAVFTMTILKYLARHAYNDAERFIYEHVLQDKARLLTYGLDHLHFAVAHDDEQPAVLATVLAIGDRVLTRDLRDPALREALAIIFGRGIRGARTHGMDTYEEMMADFMQTHLGHCRWLGIARAPAEAMPPPLDRHAGAAVAA